MSKKLGFGSLGDGELFNGKYREEIPTIYSLLSCVLKKVKIKHAFGFNKSCYRSEERRVGKEC